MIKRGIWPIEREDISKKGPEPREISASTGGTTPSACISLEDHYQGERDRQTKPMPFVREGGVPKVA